MPRDMGRKAVQSTFPNLRELASHYAREAGRTVRFAESEWPPDEAYCRDVAAYYDAAPLVCDDPRLAAAYEALAAESMRQFELVLASGLQVRPWRGTGQPYRSSAELAERVQRSGTLQVHLTADGHGPGPGRAGHPMARPTGLAADGVPLLRNDVFRVVHDVFGHLMCGHGFGPRGELAAVLVHLQMYPRAAWPVLFTEHVAQVCWFFFGPHLRDRDGRLPAAGEPGHLPPARRPYPEQKTFLFADRLIDRFPRLPDHPECRR